MAILNCFVFRGSRQRRHRRMEEEEYGAGGYEGEQYAGDGDQYTAMQVTHVYSDGDDGDEEYDDDGGGY